MYERKQGLTPARTMNLMGQYKPNRAGSVPVLLWFCFSLNVLLDSYM